MAEFEPSLFSLGLDFDLDSEPQTTIPKDPPFPKQPSSNPSFRLIEDDVDFEIPNPPQTLKRLRRGPHPSHLLRRWRRRRSGSRWRWVVTMLTMKLKSSLLRRIGIEVKIWGLLGEKLNLAFVYARPKHGSSTAWWPESIGGANEELAASDVMDCRHL
ncbi:hypothetical protein RHSIM_RhsimUnG0174200 [Rhododendron simsii]|uniref:Uncharacterized protein n=1 Tax=Rhododendron simsii TaxID=118357 RepID=A0A834L4D4_RHOSS|nr:hypothetical protein RHSIM_RhsimUnG0174200 [Rhododendron simsii]